MPSSSAVSLYRSLLRYGKQLKYTDRDFFMKKVRSKFEESKSMDSEDVSRLINLGHKILKAKRVL